MTKYHHKTLKQKTEQWVPFSISTVRYQIKIEVHITAAACQGPFHRVSVPIEPHYFRDHHFLSNGVAITTYLLVNNNKKGDITEPPYRDGKRGDGREKEPTGSWGDFPGTVPFYGKAK